MTTEEAIEKVMAKSAEKKLRAEERKKARERVVEEESEISLEEVDRARQFGLKVSLGEGQTTVVATDRTPDAIRDAVKRRFLQHSAFIIKEDVMEMAELEFRKLAIEEAIPYLEKLIKNKKAKDPDRLKAAITILNRAFGTPKETIEVSSVALKVDI